ncbi:hypothetical protein Kpol_223p5 [Vanderwaltozyma polyspora DSM 70294]|uniref:Methyltransferase type 11 domain-containing protein n=1 Tax=Vanderwaltozyma polyspora (strain ATCC 22028 / DSM 70294 / BCRC 21397 / CBS 2163 / NBRC 10782 / NRRL Y-8283 / UCD 57-17) TaxID=436907 RepID=A7TTE8_VANPO|nr:uncharacterized protein Kpol_223p5 [Vanderwaltozyma polyspora DSM 70294]EDO14462.1 hypothetical protein Kpol_223p5 [Vanderwaltozyma polyspora DSM 70294]
MMSEISTGDTLASISEKIDEDASHSHIHPHVLSLSHQKPVASIVGKITNLFEVGPSTNGFGSISTSSSSISNSNSNSNISSISISNSNSNSSSKNNITCEKKKKNTGSLHGSTGKVATDKAKKTPTYNWNSLPKFGGPIVPQQHSISSIKLPVSGAIKRVYYDPHYNKNFNMMNIFLSFNIDTEKCDSLVHARKRLQSFVHFLTQYLKTRQYIFQCYPFNMRTTPVGKIASVQTNKYESFVAGHDYSDAEFLLELWQYKAQIAMLQANSLFFSHDVVEYLFQKKLVVSNKKNDGSTDDEVAYTLPTSDNIEVVILRNLMSQPISWQLAYDEQTLNICDYSLDFSPWTAKDSEVLQFLSNLDKPISDTVRVVTDYSQLKNYSLQEIKDSSLDCMGRKLNNDNHEEVKFGDTLLGDKNYEDMIKENSTTAASTDSETNSTQSSHSHSNSSHSHNSSYTHTNSHAHSNSHNNILKHHRHILPFSENKKTSTDKPKRKNLNYEIQNKWLEDYFTKVLKNYRKIDLPTQYIIPNEIKTTVLEIAEKNRASLKNSLSFAKKYTKLILPFPDNSIPVVYCPHFWSELSVDKWHFLLNEIIRCTEPGGYVFGNVSDLKLTNINSDSSSKNYSTTFASTIERDRFLENLSLEAINNKLTVYPTRHLEKSFEDAGFVNIKCTVLYNKTGDFTSPVGCISELLTMLEFDYMIRSFFNIPPQSQSSCNNAAVFEKYVKDHMYNVEPGIGGLRSLFIVAQKPLN